ncbi:RNase H family protein [Mycetocola sp.]|uniref:RNase H family protein n=1 Tax=Mycetocola sp. TaxID=1871042 RepID=UPI0039893CDF
MTITAAADGSALGNPGPAGWAWYVDDAHWEAGGWKHATNNQGELKAVLELFRATAHLDDDLLILCDSQYVINTVTKWMRGWKAKGWRKGDGKPVMNLEIIKELDEAMSGRRYTFEWVRGHAGHPMNEAADARARAVSEAFQAGRPIPHGPGWPRENDEADAARGAAATASVPLARVADRTPAPVDVLDDAVGTDSEPTLFSLDDPDLHEVTLWLTDDEHIRLYERARQEGVSAEELLRSLI